MVGAGHTATDLLRREAFTLGFSHFGVAPAEALVEEHRRLDAWLGAGRHAAMAWMEKDTARRCDPGRVLEGARSVISVAMNYHSPETHADREDTAKISRYAWGDDYHDLLAARLESLERKIRELLPGERTRRYVDTGPVMEKAWAVRAGIGWLGKHGNVITRDLGSWIFLGEILTTVELEYDRPMEDFCGSCTRCLEACPTAAIVEPYVVDAGRCISYLTIEHRGEHAAQWQTADFQNWVYGCDICQDVCPWNSFARATSEPAFGPRPWNLSPRVEELACIDDETFRERFRKSPVKRAKAAGLRRNARTLLAQQESHRD